MVFAFLWWVKRMIILSFLFLCCVSGFGHTCFLSKMPICILCSFKKLGFFSYFFIAIFLYILDTTFLSDVCVVNIFARFIPVSYFVEGIIWFTDFLILSVKIFVLMFIISYWGLFKQYLTTPRSELYLFILPSRSFRVLDLAFKSFIYLEFIFVHGLW